MINEHLNRKERRLVKAATFGVNRDRMTVYHKFLEQERKTNQELLNQQEAEYLELEKKFLASKVQLDALRADQNKLDLEYRDVAAFLENPKGTIFQYYEPENEPVERGSDAEAGKDKIVKSKRELRWVATAAEILRERKHFMDPNVLFDAICSKYPKYKEAAVDNGKMSLEVYRSRIVSNFERTCEVSKNRKKGTPLIGMYEKKIGLYEWFGKDWRPIPTHLGVFIHANGGKNGVHALHVETMG